MLIASSELPAGKPDPRAFTAALEILSVSAAEALMIGDSLENDVRGAQNCCIPAMLLDRDGQHEATGLATLRSLDEIAFT